MLAYRSTFWIGEPIDEAVPAVRRLMVDWAERKHRASLGRCGLDELQPGGRLRVGEDLEFLLSDTQEASEDRITGFVIIEHGPTTTWTSQVMVAGGPSTHGRSLVAIEVVANSTGAEGSRPIEAAVPRFVRSMLDRFDCDDNGIRLASRPTVVGPQDVPALLRELEEEDHHGLVFVAGTHPSLPLGKWTDLVARVTERTVGQAAAYVLDAEATEAFNEEAGEGHRVAVGSLRTFVPGARFADPDDGARHRFLTTQTLLDDDLTESASRALASRSRAFTNGRALERRVRRYQAVLGARLDEILFRSDDAQTATTPPTGSHAATTAHTRAPAGAPRDVTGARAAADGQAQADARIQELSARLEETSRDLDAALKEVGLLRRRLESTMKAGVEDADQERLARQALEEEYDELQIDFAATLEDKERAIDASRRHEREISRLRRLLERKDLGEQAWMQEAPPAPEGPPSSWLDLAQWATDGTLERRLPHLAFTCDWDLAIGLDGHNDLSWISRTWEILRALDDYARARADASQEVHNLYGYLDNTPPGFQTTSRHKYKAKESDAVKNRDKYRRERTFPVPQEAARAAGGGSVFMEKHFVIASKGTVSPRLYLHDATDVEGYGKVVIGYIGPHLTNLRTN